jgi:hypothetical protein
MNKNIKIKMCKSDYKLALNKLKSYKKKYRSFNDVDNYEDSVSIDFFCEKIAKYRHYETFFPELIETQK